MLWKTQPDGLRENDTAMLDAPVAPPVRARGVRPDGTIRTTGWLQVGPWAISSGIWAAVLGLAAGAVLMSWHPMLPLLCALVAWAGWKVATRWVWPASVAINQERIPAMNLEPGMRVRLYGPIGPVGVIDHLTPVSRGRVQLHFAGGTDRSMPAHNRCQVVSLRN